jgi:molybdopterin-guanine dinucleotide biosynthesis protein A
MPEPTQQLIEDAVAELASLRQAHAEVLVKRKRDKELLAAFQSETASLQAKVTDAESRIHQMTIAAPVKAMCESLSIAPEALLTALSADYSFVMNNGVLTLLSAKDGKPVVGTDGKQVPFERDAIKNLLLSTTDVPKRKLYNAILIGSRASGAGGSSSSHGGRVQAPKPTLPHFGLR